MVWRRANRKAAWASSIVTLLAFFVLPIVVPAAVPSLSQNTYLTKMTSPAPMVRHYTAHEMDVELRTQEIENWDALALEGKAVGQRPEALSIGQKFSKTYKLPEKSVFWTQGVSKNEDGQLVGHGMLNIELVLLDKLGFDMSKNAYSLNETIRVAFKVVIPFGVLIVIGLLTKPDEKEVLDRFYVKMKTPVASTPELDLQELEKSYADTSRFDHTKMFPRSNWEFGKWTKVDAVGFVISCCVAALIVGTLFVAVSIGK